MYEDKPPPGDYHSRRHLTTPTARERRRQHRASLSPHGGAGVASKGRRPPAESVPGVAGPSMALLDHQDLLISGQDQRVLAVAFHDQQRHSLG